MVRAGTDDARGWASDQGGHEGEGVVQCGRWIEDSRVGYDADESGQDKDGEGEGFRPRCQTSDPVRITMVVVGGVLHVGIY